MSRSRRKTPIFGITTADSDGDWKAAAARRLRHRVRQHLETVLDTEPFPGKRWDVVNPWDAPKDGKHWIADPKAKWMRK